MMVESYEKIVSSFAQALEKEIKDVPKECFGHNNVYFININGKEVESIK